MKNKQASTIIAALLFLQIASTSARAQDVEIHVDANKVLHPVSRLLTGVCIEDVNHEIYGGLYSQMLFGESFQEPAPSPPIPGFTSLDGGWRIEDGVAVGQPSQGGKLVANEPLVRDGAVSVEVRFADRQNGNAGLIVRVGGAKKGADAFTGYEISLNAAEQTLRLARHRNNFEHIRDVPCDVPTGVWIPLQVTLNGSRIEITVNGKSVLIYDDNASISDPGTVGLRTWQREASFRNLSVTTDNSNTPLPFTQAERGPEVSGMWDVARRGTAEGTAVLSTQRPFVGVQSQQVTFLSGSGEYGIENRGLNRWGLSIISGKPCEGIVWARAESPVTFYAALESREGNTVYAEKVLTLPEGPWTRLDFTLKPRGSDKDARFVLKLKQPGSVTFGYAFLQPGAWGRYKGLPVRRDVVKALVRQGVTALRYGGSMVNTQGYRWKNTAGPRDLRPPYTGLWYPWSSNGWGIPDFMNLCEAVGFEYIPTFNIDESPRDMADFIDYATSPKSTEWGRVRAEDGHPAPYNLKYLELGNEERVDDAYAAKFEALASAIWARRPEIVLVVGDFVYGRHIDDPFRFGGAHSGINSLTAHQRILRFAKRNNGEVWFDVHVGTEQPSPFNSELDAMLSYADALDKIAEGARHKVVVFEYNAGNHSMKRALANALATHAVMRDGRIPVAISANGLQPDGQNDNGWDQGLLFLNPSQVWLQPPGYALQMMSRNYLPELIDCRVTGSEVLDVVASRSEKGDALVLQVVNPGDRPATAMLRLNGFDARKPGACVTVLSGEYEAVNTADRPNAVSPVESIWEHGADSGDMTYTFPARSFTVIRFD